MTTSVPLYFIDDYSNAESLKLLKTFDTSAQYKTKNSATTLTGRYKQNVDGKEYEALIKGVPFDLGGVKHGEDVLPAKGFILLFLHDDPKHRNQQLNDFNRYASFP